MILRLRSGGVFGENSSTTAVQANGEKGKGLPVSRCSCVHDAANESSVGVADAEPGHVSTALPAERPGYQVVLGYLPSASLPLPIKAFTMCIPFATNEDDF